jgi:glutamate-1-semialdehyde 2,1-aminomutase
MGLEMNRPRTSNAAGVIPGGILGATTWPTHANWVITHGAGARMWTTAGTSIIDYLLGSGPMVLGHAHPRITAAVQEQARRGTQFYAMNELAAALAERIVALVPCAQSVKFVSDGTSATFHALRLARAYTGRTLILRFEGAYHGSHDYALHGAFPDSAGIPAEIGKTVLVAPFNDLDAVTSLVLSRADDVAAIIVEPVQRTLVPKAGFLAGLRTLCDKVGALLIFDEVVTGFRLALGGAQEAFGVTPHLCALGKILGGGLPLAAIAGRHDVLDLLDPTRPNDGRSVYLDGTLNGNPLAAAAGLAMLDVLAEENGPARLAEIGTKLGQAFSDCAHRLSIPFQMIGPPCTPEPIFDRRPVLDHRSYLDANRAAAQQFGRELLQRQVFLRIGSKFYVSLAHDDDVIEETRRAAFGAMQAIRDARLTN